MLRYFASMLVAVACLAPLVAPIQRALADKPTTPVTVTNPATTPALTSSVDNPGRIPYQAGHQFTASECGLPFQCIFNFPAVPAGKRLVAQHIVVSAALSSGTQVEARIVVGNTLGSFFFVPTLANKTGGADAVGDQSVLFYVDGGSTYQAGMFTDGAFVNNPALGGPIVLMTVTDYLLDCTVNGCAAIAP